MKGLALTGLSAGYRRREVLSAARLAPVPPGSLVGVIGANGAGKTTLLKALAGLLPARGEALLDGEDVLRCPPEHRRERIGYLPQSLPQASVLLAYESVLSGLRAVLPNLARADAERRIEDGFARLGLRDLALRRLGELSGGQRQLVGLIQVLVRSPRLLLLDEPTSALDLRWQLEVLNGVREHAEREGAIALLAIHDINLAARFCDRLAVLHAGTVVADDVPERALDTATLRLAFGIEARVERCSRGGGMVLADRAIRDTPAPF